MIELGLARISRLLADSALSWRAIHVAGTNGKGSVCAYASSMLHAAGIPCGRFTSPHLIDKWDCININEKTVEEGLFRHVQDRVQMRNQKEEIGASEFELLTATAFEIFAQEKIKIGVVEVGLGGRLDATNVLKDPFVTVITKLGQDHEAFLGNTLEEIAFQKAGIMKPGVPCVVDGTNLNEILGVISRYGQEIQSGPIRQVSQHTGEAGSQIWSALSQSSYEEHQQLNMALAFEAVRIVLDRIQLHPPPAPIITALANTTWPGRLHRVSIRSLTGRADKVLLDGAHNAPSATVLGSYVDKKLRIGKQPVTWVIAVSKGKNIREMLRLFLKPGDALVTAEFGAVDGMPWVQAMPQDEIVQAAGGVCELRHSILSDSVSDALYRATELSDGLPLVVAGSLYLVSDVLRLVRNTENL
ncbi:folylpolyglutamate synthase [Trapelia coarctata]|nr:folylpolyglutamate synthase [Trapelia coarctata]